MGSEWQIPTDGSWLIKSPRLEANFGRMGAEFQQLLEGSGECQLGEWKEEDLFSMPTKIAFNNRREPTLLEQLQESLLTQESKVKLFRQSRDNSISFIASPNPIFGIFSTAILLKFLFFIFLKVLYKFFAASLRLLFLLK